MSHGMLTGVNSSAEELWRTTRQNWQPCSKVCLAMAAGSASYNRRPSKLLCAVRVPLVVYTGGPMVGFSRIMPWNLLPAISSSVLVAFQVSQHCRMLLP